MNILKKSLSLILTVVMLLNMMPLSVLAAEDVTVPSEASAEVETTEAAAETTEAVAETTQAPETEAPETEAPETEVPETEAPATESAETEAPADEDAEEETPEAVGEDLSAGEEAAYAAGTQDDPHIIETATGAVDGKTLYNTLKNTLKLAEGTGLMGASIGYWVDNRQLTSLSTDTFSEGTYEVYKCKRSGLKYGAGDRLATIKIQKQSAEDAALVIKGEAFDIPVNFYYDMLDEEQDLLNRVVEIAATKNANFDPEKSLTMEVWSEIASRWLTYDSSIDLFGTTISPMVGKKDGDSDKVRLVYDGVATAEFALTFKESRPTVTITDAVGPTETLVYADKPADGGAADVKANTTFQLSPAAASKDAVTFSADNYHFGGAGLGTNIEEGESADITFTLRLANTADYIGSSAEVTANIRNITDENKNGEHDAEETKYIVEWVNGETSLKSVESLSGLTVAYDGEEPAKASDGDYNYYYAGWDTNGDGMADISLTDGITVGTGKTTAVAVYTAKAIYTVKFDFNGGVDAEGNTELSKALEVGSATPAAPEVTRKDHTFTGWSPAIAETVTAPAEGKVIVYTAQWTQLPVVTFLGGDESTPDNVIVGVGEAVAQPADPSKENHDFLGWYLGDKLYDFATPVTGDITLTAKWRADFNHNDIEDSEEDHFTITYDVDGVKTSFENVLVDTATPAFDADANAAGNQNPAKTGYIFHGWDPAVAAAVTADATYVAQWLKDANGNGVDDGKETVVIATAGAAGSFTVTGATAGEGDNYIYDSEKVTSITIKATPETAGGISSTYVQSITVDGEAAELTYASDFSAAATVSLAAARAAEVQSKQIVVTFADAGFVYNEERLLNYYPGMTSVDNDEVYNTIVDTPDLTEDAEYTIAYFARPAASVEVSLLGLGLGDTIEGLLTTFKVDSITIDLEEMWLDVNVEDMSGLIQDSVDLNTAVQNNLNAETVKELVQIFEENNVLTAISKLSERMTEITEDIKDAAMYYGAHNFGYNSGTEDTVTEKIRITFKDKTRYIEGENTIDLKDLRASSLLHGSNVSVVYKDYTDEDLIDLIGAYVTDVDGNVIEGASATAIMLTESTMEGKGVSETELTFKFAGNETYKPSEAVFTVTVTKAGAKYDAPNMTLTYGESYSMLSDSAFTLDNKYGEASELAKSMIQFVVGLNAADLAVDAEGNVTGLKGKIQIILPDELKDILDLIQNATGGNVEEGIELSLDELLKYLDLIPEDSLGSLSQILNAIAGIADAGELKIVLGGTLPKDVGAYLYGAVSTSSNYETVFDVSYILIKPDATQVYLDWNFADTNGIFTYELIRAMGLGASAYDDAAFTVKNEAATGKINNLIFGVVPTGFDAETKEPTFELKLAMYDAYGNNTDEIEKDLPVGAYTQLAFIGEFGNELHYAHPIVRAFVLAPNAVTVEIGDSQDTNHVTFTNKPVSLDVAVTHSGDNIAIDTDKYLTMTYTGVQTNGKVYGPTQAAPTHAGAYAVAAVYLQKEGQQLVAVGADLEALIIKPADSQVQVDNKTVVYDKAAADVPGMIHAGPQLEGMVPQVTVITAGINTNGSFSENGLMALQGVVNMDLPGWLDEILISNKILEAAYAEGVTNEVARDYLNQVSTMLEDKLNFRLFEGTVNILETMPHDVTITFHDLPKAEPTAVGAYLVAAVVTDPNYIPSFNAGFLVIQPELTEVKLEWNYVDANNVFLLESLPAVDLSAKAILDGQATDLDPVEIYIGVDTENWTIKQYQRDELTLGAFTEIASLVEINAHTYIAQPIFRSFVVVPGTVDVAFKNDGAIFTYNGQPQGLDVVVTENGKTLTVAEGEITVLYTGIDFAGKPYSSTTAPTNAGFYAAAATYKKYTEKGELLKAGAATGTMAIGQADLKLDFVDTTVAYTGEGQMVTVTSNDPAADYLTVVVDKQANTINFILEDDLTLAAGALKALLEKELGKPLANEFDVTQVQKALHAIIDKIEAFEIPEELKALANKLPAAAQEELKALEKHLEALKEVLADLQEIIPLSGTVVFNGELPAEPGVYQFYGASVCVNYYPQLTEGVLTIVKVDLSAEELELKIGETDTITVTAEPEDVVKSIVFESSDDTVVTVDEDGNVTAISDGTAEITVTVTTKDGLVIEKKIPVTVSKIPVTITAVVSPEEIAVGEKAEVSFLIDGKVGTLEGLDYVITDAEGKEVSLETAQNTPGTYIVTPVFADSKYNPDLQSAKLTVKQIPITITAVVSPEKIAVGEKAEVSFLIDGKAGTLEGLDYVITDAEGKEVSLEDAVNTIGTYTVTPVFADSKYDADLQSAQLVVKGYAVKGFTEGEEVEINGNTYTPDEDGTIWISKEDHDAIQGLIYRIVTSYDYATSENAVEDPMDPGNKNGHKDYPENMYVWFLTYDEATKTYSAEEIKDLENFLAYQGTSIRWNKKLTEKNAVRVHTNVPMSERADLIDGTLLNGTPLEGLRLVEYGTQVQKAGGTKIMKSQAYFTNEKGKLEDRIFAQSKKDNFIQYTGAFVFDGDNAETSKMELQIRTYMILQDANGNQVTIYGGELQRTIGYVALQNQNTYKNGTAADKFIENIIGLYLGKAQG